MRLLVRVTASSLLQGPCESPPSRVFLVALRVVFRILSSHWLSLPPIAAVRRVGLHDGRLGCCAALRARAPVPAEPRE